MKISRLVVPAVLGLMGLSSTWRGAHADTINVDFNSASSPTYSGLGAAPDTGTVWNGVSPIGSGGTVFTSGLLNSTGGATTVSLSGILGTIVDRPNGLGASGNSASGLLRDYFSTTSSSLVTINGLTSGTSYNLYLYGVGGDAPNTGGNSLSLFSVSGAVSNPPSQLTTGAVAATTGLTLGEDYVVFNNVIPMDNSLSIIYLGLGGLEKGTFNGFQIVATPEPSTYAMMALGLVALCVLGARRKKDEAAI